VPSGEPRAQGWGLARVALLALAFSVVAPAGLWLVPLAALLLASRPRSRSAVGVTVALGALALLWLLQRGDPPDQLTRGAAVLGGAAFVLATYYSSGSVTHRALLAVTAAALGLLLLFPVLGWSWGRVTWWVQHRTGFAVRLVLGQLGPVPASAGGAGLTATEIEQWFESGVHFMADQFAAILAIQFLGGLALAAAIYYRVSDRPVGRPPGRFRDFRFSEHLGWAGALALVVVLVPRLAAAKGAALNLLLVAGLMYAVRGAAVAAFGLALMGGAGWGTALLGVLVVLFILPAAVAGSIVVGVLDAGLDLRRRWARSKA
jgi:Predicted membrane protein (DUF2232)